ncbi:hypothetical protein ACFXJ6_17505 [Streptomyces sp. NPDC059218]|uniref:hypothetical protein n=1 Tax=Streptomyces sp. NPDC059218 TaxID=3346773 RepID=UPI0036877771
MARAWLVSRFEAERVAEWELRQAARAASWRLLSSQTKRDRLAQVYGDDALMPLHAVRESDAPRWLRGIEPVRPLRQVPVQTGHGRPPCCAQSAS